MSEFHPLWIDRTAESSEGFESLSPSMVGDSDSRVEGFEPLSSDPNAFSMGNISSSLVIDEASAGPDDALGDDEALGQVRAEYFEAGRQEGIAQGRAEIQAEVDRILALGAGFSSLREEVFSRSVKDVADAAIHIATQVVRRELATDSGSVEQLVLSTLEHVRTSDELVIRLSPNDHQALGELAPKLFDRLGRDASFRIEVSPDLAPGGVVVQTDYGRIDASVEAQVRAFAETAEAWAREEVGVFDDES